MGNGFEHVRNTHVRRDRDVARVATKEKNQEVEVQSIQRHQWLGMKPFCDIVHTYFCKNTVANS